jgi:hypothetical protein
MDNLEAVYDTEISPLMQQILAICQAKGIPMFASFQFSDDGFCTSALVPEGGHGVFHHYQALAQSAGLNGVNVDTYLFWVAKQARTRGHSSMFLMQAGVPLQPAAPDTATATG